jgi:hypothetical protein
VNLYEIRFYDWESQQHYLLTHKNTYTEDFFKSMFEEALSKAILEFYAEHKKIDDVLEDEFLLREVYDMLLRDYGFAAVEITMCAVGVFPHNKPFESAMSLEARKTHADRDDALHRHYSAKIREQEASDASKKGCQTKINH